MKRGTAVLTGKMTKRQVETAGQGRHGDGNGLYLVVDPSGARRWIVRLTIKGQRNREGKPLRTDLGLGPADLVPLAEARQKAVEFRRLAYLGLNPRDASPKAIPTFEEMAIEVHRDRLPTWRNAKHGQQWINTLHQYVFPKIGRMRVCDIGQPEVMACLSPLWIEKHETARRLAQRIKVVLDVAWSKGLREGENPVTAIKEGGVLPKVKVLVQHHKAMDWRDVPAFYADLQRRPAMAAKALMLTCLTGTRTSETLKARWEEFDFAEKIWSLPAARTKTHLPHRIPITDEMLAIIEPLRALNSDYAFEGQKRNRPLSNMAMLMLLRRMNREQITVHGFRSTFRDWASEVAHAPREIAEMSLSHQVGSNVERSYARSDLLDRRRVLMEKWSAYVVGRRYGQDS
jgi:integrase